MRTRSILFTSLLVWLSGSTAFGAQIAACKGVSPSIVTQAEQSAQTQACARAAQYVIGTEKATKQNVTADAKAIFLSLESQFSLPPFCAASIVAVLAQELSNGKLSAGSCPAK